MTLARRAIKKNRGIAVILALFFMILLSLIAIALIGLVPVELRSATRNKLDLQAHYAATSGIRHAKAWCSAVMTPATSGPDALGDPIGAGVGTSGNQYYPSGGSYANEITGVNGTHAKMEYTAMQLEDLWNSGLIPRGTARWTTVYQMLNIPGSGPNTVDPKTIIVVKKAPLTLGDWTVHTVVIPDSNSPGGVNSLNSGKTQVATSFGGAGAAGRRAYQIIAIGYYQGFPTIRAKSTVLEDSFARYSLFVNADPSNTWALQANKNEVTTFGPVHTNSFFRFAINPDTFDSSNTQVPFNGLMTHASVGAETDGIDANFVGKDGNRYYEGNDVFATDADKRPFDDNGNEVSARYTKLFGGKGNLRKAANVALPPDSTKISNAAYGSDYVVSGYTGTASAHFKSNGAEPDGLFVFPNSDGKAAGGVVVKNDQEKMFLEVVGQDGKPVTDVAALEAGTATGNPGIRVQAKTAQTAAASTQTTIQTTVGTITNRSTLTTGSTTGTSVGRSTITTGYSTTTGTSRSTLFSTQTTTSWSTNTRTLFSTQTLTGTSVSTSRSTSYFTTRTTVGGAGGVVQMVTSSSVRDILSTLTTTRTSTVSTGTSLSSSSRTGTTRVSTGTTIRTTTGSTPLRTTISSTFTTTRPLTTVSTSLSFGTTFNTITNVIAETFKPIDQVIEARNVGLTLNPTMFAASTSYRRPPGSIGTQNDMDVSKLGGITAMSLLQNGSLSSLGATTVGTGNVVLIKQSRTDPTVAIVTIIPAEADDEGKLLNGAVLTEGHIGDEKQSGLAGVNMGRKTIGGQIDIDPSTPEASGASTLFTPRPEKSSTRLGIGNSVWQFGTKLSETDQTKLRADNGLGLVAEDIRVNASADDFHSWNGRSPLNYLTHQMLNIHAVILAGSSRGGGGLTIKGFTNIDDLTSTNLGSGPNQTPLIRFMGGLILQNYYPRINGVTGAGWNSKNIYNQQLALVPPPYFPNNGLLIPLSYVEERIWADQSL